MSKHQEIILNLYDRWILPPILDLAMRQSQLQKYRREVVAAAEGRVLEVGIGSGLNFPLYGKQVEIVFGIDPSPRLLEIAHRRAAAPGVRVQLLQGSATAIPLADNTMDTAVMTWTLCSIADPLAALREIRRVLETERQIPFCRTWTCTRTWSRALATQAHAYLEAYRGRLSLGSENRRSYSIGWLRPKAPSNGIRNRATSDDLHVRGVRTVSECL